MIKLISRVAALIGAAFRRVGVALGPGPKGPKDSK